MYMQTNRSCDGGQAYDIYLYCRSTGLHALKRIAIAYHSLMTPTVQYKMRQEHPGFLGLNISEALAKTLLARLRETGADGEVIAAAYHEPLISVDEAAVFAERYIERRRQERFPAYDFEPARHWRQGDRPRWWGFFAPSPKLQDEGHIPGAIFASVDKLDGHIWTYEEQEQLARELGQLE
jgi:hypothetical protein